MALPTANKTLTGAYQSIGAGPGLITLEIGSRAEVHFTNGAAPSTGSAFHSILRGGTTGDRSWTQVPTGMTAHARKRTGDEETIIAFTQS